PPAGRALLRGADDPDIGTADTVDGARLVAEAPAHREARQQLVPPCRAVPAEEMPAEQRVGRLGRPGSGGPDLAFDQRGATQAPATGVGGSGQVAPRTAVPLQREGLGSRA